MQTPPLLSDGRHRYAGTFPAFARIPPLFEIADIFRVINPFSNLQGIDRLPCQRSRCQKTSVSGTAAAQEEYGFACGYFIAALEKMLIIDSTHGKPVLPSQTAPSNRSAAAAVPAGLVFVP
jgi:hypothetical protein